MAKVALIWDLEGISEIKCTFALKLDRAHAFISSSQMCERKSHIGSRRAERLLRC